MLRPWSLEDAALRPTTRGWVLAGLLVAGSITAWLLALAPDTSLARTDITIAVGVAQVLLALVAVRARASTRGLWAAAAGAVLLVTVLVANADTGVRLLLALSAYTYLVLYAAYAFEHRAMRALLWLVVGGSVLGGLISPIGLRPIVWLCTVGGLTAAGGVIGRLVTRLRFYATIDSLTGVLTRTAFDAVATAALAGCRRRGEPLCLAVVDLDEFKNVNDTHGHAAGDAMLGRVVDSWRTRLRSQDVLGRIGGDEFAVLLPGSDLAGATRLLEDLAGVSPVAFSAGLAVAGPDDDVLALRCRADAGMYAVKRGKPRPGGPEALRPAGSEPSG